MESTEILTQLIPHVCFRHLMSQQQCEHGRMEIHPEQLASSARMLESFVYDHALLDEEALENKRKRATYSVWSTLVAGPFVTSVSGLGISFGSHFKDAGIL